MENKKSPKTEETFEQTVEQVRQPSRRTFLTLTVAASGGAALWSLRKPSVGAAAAERSSDAPSVVTVVKFSPSGEKQQDNSLTFTRCTIRAPPFVPCPFSLVPVANITLSHPSTGLEELIQKANDLIRAAKAPSTRKSYQSDFRIYESWCTDHGLTSLPSTPETIALYIASCVVAHLAPATIARRLASISKAHQAAGFEDSPASTKHFVVGEVLKGARRTLGIAQNCKDPLLLNDICRLLAACPKNLLGLRDRALILTGFAGAFRRSELCAMAISDLSFSDAGLVINVPRSKADQEQAGEKVAIPFGEHDDTCPIKALREYIRAANVTEGAVFRGVDRYNNVAATGLHRDSIAAIFKTAAMRAGMNATNIAGHSVRAGMATQAALNGSSERAIAKTTRHRSRRVLRRYIRPGEMFRENASASLGL